MKLLVDRTVSRFDGDHWVANEEKLSDFRSANAYVLLGEPGAGKSSAFKQEAKNIDNGFEITARHFLRPGFNASSDWKDTTLFIDGLDEVRVGKSDMREPIDMLVDRLEEHGNPRFRLSCQENFWLGQSDLSELSKDVEEGEFHILRLDPLTSEDTYAILETTNVKDPEMFYWRAVDSGLATFLRNPLLLDILVKANDSGEWSVGRLATFESACKELAKESKQEHLNARDGQAFGTDAVVLAAGRLCLLLLLCGYSGWSRRGPGNDELLALSEAGDEQDLLKFGVDSKLFQGDAETGRRPRHRQISEFLAASYLDYRIRNHALSSKRVLAWMRGIDGKVVPDLRGVSIWLAARNPSVRRSIIESDPVGVAYQGDSASFSSEDTAYLFDALESELEYQLLTEQLDSDSSLSLSTLMEGSGRIILYEMLHDNNRSDVRLHLVERMLRGLGEATLRRVRSSEEGREDDRKSACMRLALTVRDASWGSSVRRRALFELTWIIEELGEDTSILLDLLEALAGGEIAEDDEGRLGIRLLDSLYPDHLSAQEFWNYIEQLWTASPPEKESPFGDKRLWAQRLVENLAPADVRSLLESLVTRARSLNKVLARNDTAEFAAHLLTRSVEFFGETLDPSRLYEWFELMEVTDQPPGLVLAHCGELSYNTRWSLTWFNLIYDWLAANREVQQALILQGLHRNASFPRERALESEFHFRFVGDSIPQGFRRWCLQTAKIYAETRPGTALELAIWSSTTWTAWGEPLDDTEVLPALASTSLLQEWLKHTSPKSEFDRRPQPISSTHERPKHSAVSIRRHLEEIETGLGPIEVLHELGRIYMEGFDVGNEKRARADLADRLGDDDDLLEAVTCGFRKLLKRTDLPSMEEIADLYARRIPSLIDAPFLAGLVEEICVSGRTLEHLDQTVLRRALIFYQLSGQHSRPSPIPISFRHTLPHHLKHPDNPRPTWYHRAVEKHPQSVADAFVMVNRARVQAGEYPVQHLYDLAWETVDCDPVWELEYGDVARLAVPHMFAAFPARCTRVQVVSLRLVLWASLKFMPHDDLSPLVSRKLCRKTMDLGQRGSWLATGLFLDRETYLPKVVEFLSAGTEKRRDALINFLVPDREPLPGLDWPTADLVVLIEATFAKSPRLSPDTASPGGWKLFPLLDYWLSNLSERVDDETFAALQYLADNPMLQNCRGQLLRARDQQAKKRRVSVYRSPTMIELQKGLEGGPPINPADLAELVYDNLCDLASRVRDGNTDDWQQYWHTDPRDAKGRMVIKPKAEEPCRDALLSDLQLRLESYDVDARPEGHHAEDTRSDILAIYGNHAVVTEVKKSDSEDLWSAIHDQLIAKYARDPRSGGYGIYVVFWFGEDYVQKPSSKRSKPRSPEELSSMLKEVLTNDQRRKTKILVVDVSAPHGRVVPEA